MRTPLRRSTSAPRQARTRRGRSTRSTESSRVALTKPSREARTQQTRRWIDPTTLLGGNLRERLRRNATQGICPDCFKRVNAPKPTAIERSTHAHLTRARKAVVCEPSDPQGPGQDKRSTSASLPLDQYLPVANVRPRRDATSAAGTHDSRSWLSRSSCSSDTTAPNQRGARSSEPQHSPATAAS